MSEHTQADPMEHTAEHTTNPRLYFIVFAILLVLLVFTVAVAYLDLGGWSIVLAMAIATTKALLVILYFMHVRYSSRLIWLFVGLGFVFLALLVALTLTDYLSRGWLRG